MDIGDIVTPEKPHVLAAGSWPKYDRAIVASIEPFILLSEDEEILWQAQMPHWFIVVGKANHKATLKALKHARRHDRHSPKGCMTIWNERPIYELVTRTCPNCGNKGTGNRDDPQHCIPCDASKKGVHWMTNPEPLTAMLIWDEKKS